MPFTFNQVPKDPKEYKYLNRFGSVTMYLKVCEDLEKASLLAKKETDRLKNSLVVVGMFLLTELYTRFFPNAWINLMSLITGRKHTMIVSTVPGFLQRVTYGGGSKVTRFFSLISGTSNLATAINLVSVEKTVQFCLNSDIS